MKPSILTNLAASVAALTLVPSALASLATYDAAIAADNAGALPYAAVLTSASTFDSTNVAAFDFGSITGAATFEFIIEGDPEAGGQNGYIGQGSNVGNSLRYEQWDNTGTLGFTRSGVADYNLGVASPTAPTHIAYRWDGAGTMDLYVDGALSGTVAGATFEMPTGAGLLGNVSDGGGEGMIGTIHRVTTYDSALDPAAIGDHANAWLVPEPSGVALLGLAGLAMIVRRRR
ncbi:MAG: LamG-like jellyroll fold domain-containing protein [Verrucomicrobiales bacterium]